MPSVAAVESFTTKRPGVSLMMWEFSDGDTSVRHHKHIPAVVLAHVVQEYEVAHLGIPVDMGQADFDGEDGDKMAGAERIARRAQRRQAKGVEDW